MRVDLRDKVVRQIETAWKWAGANDFDDGMRLLRLIAGRLNELTTKIKSKGDFESFLDAMPDPSLLEEKLILGTLRFFPQICRGLLVMVAGQVAREIPAPPVGRPPTDLQLRANVARYVGELHTQGYSLEVAKKSAARKFHASYSTVQRIWDDRGSISEADFQSAFRWLSQT